MRKQRDGVHPGMAIHAGPVANPGLPRERLQVAFMDQPEDMSTTHLQGIQYWGPWAIRLPERVSGPDFRIKTRHRCHAPWETQTLNMRVTASSVFGEITASADAPRADTPR